MINVSHALHMPHPIWSAAIDVASHHTGRSLDPTSRRITGKIVFFNLEFKFLLISQAFMLQDSQMGPTLMMSWR
jgi:hypothetical protein